VSATRGQASPGAQVSFSVTSGGGNVAPSSVATNSSGDAHATWTLGKAIGANTLSVVAGSLSAVAVTATGTAGPPSTLVIPAGAFTGVFGRAPATLPTVTVLDANQNPVAGVAVTFATTTPSAVLTGATPTTDAQGKAQLGSWVLGDVAAQTVTASVSGVAPVTFQATAKNPWVVTTPSGHETDATVLADQGSISGSGPPWASTALINPPSLVVSCTSGIIFIDVEAALLVTQSGAVTYRFDGGTLESSTWDQLAPNFNVLFFPTRDPVVESPFIHRLATASLFNIAFRDRSGATYSANFNMHGLAAVLAQTMAACPSFTA
jgi:hypothetical protein